jgi:hypothetical protein
MYLNPFERLKLAVKDAEEKLSAERDRFVYECRALAETLKEEALRTREDPSRTPNSLGVIQGRAFDIDSNCVRIAQLTEECKCLRRLLGSMSEVQHP